MTDYLGTGDMCNFTCSSDYLDSKNLLNKKTNSWLRDENLVVNHVQYRFSMTTLLSLMERKKAVISNRANSANIVVKNIKKRKKRKNVTLITTDLIKQNVIRVLIILQRLLRSILPERFVSQDKCGYQRTGFCLQSKHISPYYDLPAVFTNVLSLSLLWF